MLTITWNSVANQYKVFMDGTTQVGATQAASAFALTLTSTVCCTGSSESNGLEPWKGSLCHHMIWDRVLTPAEITTLYDEGIASL